MYVCTFICTLNTQKTELLHNWRQMIGPATNLSWTFFSWSDMHNCIGVSHIKYMKYPSGICGALDKSKDLSFNCVKSLY